ncbi:hypothetical protein SAMN05444420_10236 [Capnocytophaga granulosa]|uniref:Uncharacterized protein n=1 Tax=Capnocytophaga granulosa TaxID=45242 RepID=A0A1H2SZL0_9FLAO|nr:hypothetical protein [Capnocytophaga granulosa]SDW36905.1 hypothetical protein SAMN05444420_10236 [Capnocytophaga granulosa]SUX15210.1 Uncharacterised protein [Capnocytophaga granulosa]
MYRLLMWGGVLSLNVEMCYFLNVEMCYFLNVEMCYFLNVEMYCVLVGFDSFEE